MSDTEVTTDAAGRTRAHVVVLDPRSDDALDRLDRDGDGERRVPGVSVDFGREPAPFGHAAGLDGLRAVAVAAVLLYHAHASFLPGGFLGVSVFFTLSGYLITSLLLRERHRDGSISLKGFWSRRFRRLLPAGLACQALVLAMAAAGVWDADQLRSLRADVPAALAQVVNWSFIVRGTSYVSDTTAPSPLNHYWSLSIEEQFYVLFPLVVAGALLWGRSRRRLLVGLLVVGVAASAWASARHGAADVDRAYFGLDTRLAELLVGALLACATLYRVQMRQQWQRVALAVLGVAGAVGLLWLMGTATVSSQWLYPWGLLATSACSAALIAAAVQRGPLARGLGIRPMVQVGMVSYGLYLYHWPVFQWLTPRRTGLSQWPLFGVRMVVTAALAIASYHLLEQPIRSRRWLRGARAAWAAPVAMAALVGALLLTTMSLPERNRSLDGLLAAGAGPSGGAGAAVAAPQRMLVVGDEVALSLVPTGVDVGEAVEVRVAAQPGCGVMTAGWRHVTGMSREQANPEACGAVPGQWALHVEEFAPDVVVVAAGGWDVTDRQFWSEDPVRRPGEQTFDDLLATEIASRVDELSAGGATVAWLTMPPQRRVLPGLDAAAESLPENDPARIDHYNEIVRTVAADHPRMDVVEFAAWMAEGAGGALDPARRPDGVTLAPDAAAEALAWVARQVRDVRREVDTSPAEAAAAMTDPSTDGSLPPAPAVPPRNLPTGGQQARVMVVGDSVAFGLGYGLEHWAEGERGVAFENKGQFNCPVARGGSYRFQQEVHEFPDRCDWAPMWSEWVGTSRPHLVVLTTGVWDVVDRVLPGTRRWQHIGDPAVDDYLVREMLTAVDLLSSQGARVALLTHHHIDVGANKGFTGLPESEPARIDRLNELIGEVAALRPQVASVVDLGGWVASQPGGELDPNKLTDGLHFTDDYLDVIGRWLGPELVREAHRP